MKSICTVILVFITLFSDAFSQDIKGNYAIRNTKTGMLLRVKDAASKNGTPLVAYSPQNWKCMTWNFKSTGGNAYQLENLLTHKTFQPQSSAAHGILLEEQPLLAGNPQQQYEFIPVKKGTFLIKMKGTDLYITPSDPQGSVNSTIILARRNTTDLQYWTIYEQAPTM
ncbi:RICIN domain-containing protein [Arcticibacter eurypsychrophilus]|uniref:RICIN domain-containing protein n=1 Tax=Arcticibacter eurypsychrophilus TaxID=1434752 RepID=UPI00084DBA1C|nr:RICIN domain-containing protein [Arcticibacter eurypsychrophilus]